MACEYSRSTASRCPSPSTRASACRRDGQRVRAVLERAAARHRAAGAWTTTSGVSGHGANTALPAIGRRTWKNGVSIGFTRSWEVGFCIWIERRMAVGRSSTWGESGRWWRSGGRGIFDSRPREGRSSARWAWGGAWEGEGAAVARDSREIEDWGRISAGHGSSAGGGRKERKEMAVQGRITRSVDRSAWIPKFEGQARAGGSGGFSVLTNGSLTVNILGDGCCMSNVSPPFSKYYQTNVDKFN